jgi:hypothetical protein
VQLKRFAEWQPIVPAKCVALHGTMLQDLLIPNFACAMQYTLVTLGPLTNLATAIIACPSITVNLFTCIGSVLTEIKSVIHTILAMMLLIGPSH